MRTFRRSFEWLIAFILVINFTPAFAAEKDFVQWLSMLRSEAYDAGIRKSTVDRALDNAQQIPKVLALYRRQPESIISFATYIQNVVTADRVRQGCAWVR